MSGTTYHRPRTPEEAAGLLGDRRAEAVGGGTDLLPLIEGGIARPGKLVSLASLPDDFRSISEVARPRASVVLGAGVKLADLAASTKIPAVLVEAAEGVGSPQLRNVATLGGNLCQRNRCVYFRDEHAACLLKGGSECFALEGENSRLAIFTAGRRCVAIGPSTLAPVLIALGATVTVQGRKGQRTLSLAKFYQAPASPRQREHVLADDELLLYVNVPTDVGRRAANYEVRPSEATAWPLVQAAVTLDLDGGRAKGVRVVLGQVAATPLLSAAAAAAVEGRAVTEETAAAAGAAATKGARPLARNGYKVRLLEVAVKRAVLLAGGAKRYWE